MSHTNMHWVRRPSQTKEELWTEPEQVAGGMKTSQEHHLYETLLEFLPRQSPAPARVLAQHRELALTVQARQRDFFCERPFTGHGKEYEECESSAQASFSPSEHSF